MLLDELRVKGWFVGDGSNVRIWFSGLAIWESDSAVTDRGRWRRAGGARTSGGSIARGGAIDRDEWNWRWWAGTHVVEDGSVVVHRGGHRGGAPVGILEVEERGTATESLEDLGVAVGGGDHGGGLAGHLMNAQIVSRSMTDRLRRIERRKRPRGCSPDRREPSRSANGAGEKGGAKAIDAVGPRARIGRGVRRL